MDYNDFIPRKEGYSKFLEERKKLNDALDRSRSEFLRLFDEVVKKASEGDPIMQDLAAYYYRSGAERALDEDYRKYMHYEILSAAQGNEFAIEKLQFFLGYAYDQFVDHAEFGKIKYYNNIDEYNYIYIIGQAICEQLVEKLGLDAAAISKTRDVYDPFKPEYFRDLRRAVDQSVPIVIDKMKQPK